MREYGRYPERDSDIRWKLEGNYSFLITTTACIYEPMEDVPNPLIEEVKKKLRLSGWKIQGPLPCSRVFPGGSGTFDALIIPIQSNDSECVDVYFSRLGPYARTVMSHLRPKKKKKDQILAPSFNAAMSITEKALNEVGIQLLDQTLLDFVFPDLCVYFFGSRVPLPIKDLLFYWQD